MRTFINCKLSSLMHKNNAPLIIGICVGIALSLIITPFQKNCGGASSSFTEGMRLSNIRDLRSNNAENAEEDFEPNIKLNDNIEINKKGNEDRHSGKLIRPRYYSTELGMKDKVLVAVISTKESISSFGVPINKTLNHYVDKLIFFLDGTGTKKLGLNIPIVGFKEFKPHIKIFRILSYISETYSEDYNYFMFVTDHTYINGKKLMSLLEQLSVSRNIHLGALQNDNNALYCNLDGGIIISQSVLRSVSKELIWCIKHSFSDLDSDNFGRCILHASNVPCTSNFQDQTFKSYKLQKHDLEKLNLRAGDEEIRSNMGESVTVSNLETPSDISKLHIHFLQHSVLRALEDIDILRESIKDTMKFSPLNVSYPWPVGSPNTHVPPTRHDLIIWETFNATHMFMPNDMENVRVLSGIDWFDIENVMKNSIAHIKEKYSNKLSFVTLNYGHRRYDPTRGMDYLLSLTFKDNNEQLIKKRIEGYRGVTQPEFIQMPYVTENVRVNILLFIQTNEVNKALDFMTRLQEKVKIEQVTVTFCCLFNEGESYLAKDDPYKALKNVLKEFTTKYYNQGSRATFLHVKVPGEKPSDFGLLDVTLRKLPNDSLVLFVDVASVFDTDFVNRVRMNTILGCQVFSPIPFVLFHPDLVEDTKSYEKKELTSKNGHFDKYNFQILSFYIEDYFQARRNISSKIPIIKSENNLKKDLRDYETSVLGMFLAVTRLHVLRGVEPSLVMPYSEIKCPVTVAAESSFCEERQSLSLGLKSTLSKLVYEYQEMKARLGSSA